MALLAMGALLFALAEGARYYGLKADARDGTKLAAESLFAGYQPFLLEEYGIFFLDGNFGGSHFRIEGAEDEIRAFLCENFIMSKEKDGVNLYRMQAAEAEVTGYLLATDANGKVFEMQAAKTMKQKLGKQIAKKILEDILGVKNPIEKADSPNDAIKDAEGALKEIEAAKEAQKESDKQKETETGTEEMAEGKTQTMENPLDVVKKLKKEGILSLVLPKGQAVSEKKCGAKDALLKRKCRKGTWKYKENPGWYERILMQEFLKLYAGNAAAPKEDGILSYGMEYLICGKESDEENLKGTVKKLLLIREIANYLYLQTDKAKRAEAAAAALAVSSALASPELMQIIEQGILAAWAYAESLCDVKALLSGGKIPLIKTAAGWQTELSNLKGVLDSNYAGESKGLSYAHYLDVLLYERSVKQIAYRGMDLMEWQLREKKDGRYCRMDHMIAGILFTAEYEADTLFFDIFGEDSVGGYRFFEKEEYIYGP